MTTADRTLLDAFTQVFGTPTWTPPPSPATYEDEDTLRRSFGGLSKSARSAQRRPVPIKVDEYGYDRRGRYWAGYDGGAA